MLRVLTGENTTFSMNDVPDEVEINDIRYCVLDYSNQNDVDYLWMPLIFLESFSSPAVDLRIGKYRIQLPLDWSIVIGEKDLGDIEIISLVSINDRAFNAFCFNPLTSYIPEFLEIEIMNVFPDVKWYVPKLKYGHILAVPLRDCTEPPKKDEKGRWLEYGPQVAFCLRDTNKIPDALDIRKLF